jgi:type I restriction enzyme S subunit
LDEVKSMASTALDKAGALRRALLAEAFGGRLVVQEPNDEPASILLERIRAEQAAAPKQRRGRRYGKKVMAPPVGVATQEELPL